VLAWGSGWLMLWTLGFYLTHNGQQAALFLPHGVYLALLILLSRRYWPALVLPLLMLLWLHGEQLLNGYILLAAPLIGLLPPLSPNSSGTAFPLLAAADAAAGHGDRQRIAQHRPALAVCQKPGDDARPGLVYRRRAADAVCLSDF
jgi:hypothetical protein